MMASKRRTFHVDWDSPSHETGTVKRRPASLSASFLTSSNNYFENVEYYELRDCAGGYDLRHLELTRSKSENESAAEDVCEMEAERSAIVKDNGNCSKYPQSNYPRKKNTPRGPNDDPEKFKALARAKRAFVDEQEPSQEHSRSFGVEERRKDFVDHYLAKNRNFHIEKEIKDEADKRFENVGGICLHDLFSEEAEVKKDFGLKLYCESFEWKSTVNRMTKIRRSKSLKSRSLIPRPTVARSCTTRGLVSSSSESSGFGSPLSPLSPHQDPSIGTSTTKDIIKTSDSKSSGLGSPGSPSSPLSPESQKYSAFCLIQLQLEKLRNCSCEKRQAEVICTILEFFQEIECNIKLIQFKRIALILRKNTG
ncbi:unnamed protein product [Lasius platythorax]|uniref:Uncharacterized protein n=1 Tax=Lasius platythorax TaxID=488582 RepID=A0AAV2P9R5_9HYME